jgi:hypothetical protein
MPFFLGFDDYWTDCSSEGQAGQACTFFVDVRKPL